MDSAEQVDLRLTGVVVKREGMLRVYNRVYEQVFDHDWLERSLAALRPYGVAIAAWLGSGMQDESRLLRGQTLQEARTWAEGKSLGDDDRRFLDASQELEKRDIQKKFDIEAEEKRILANANRKANQRIRFGSIALVSMLTIAIVSGFAVQQKIGAADQKVQESKREAEKFQGEAAQAEDKRKVEVAKKKDAEDQRTLAEVGKKDAEVKAKQAARNLEMAELRVAEAKQQAETATTQVEQAEQERGQAQLSAAQAKQGKEQADIAAMQARQQENAARTQVALAKAELSKVGELEIASRVESANTLFELDQKFKGLLESLRAVNRIKALEATSPVNSETKFGAAIALSQAVYGTREQNVIPVLPSTSSKPIKLSPRNTMVAYEEEGDYDSLRGRIRVWNLNGKEMGNFQERNYPVFSPDEKTILLTLLDRVTGGGTLKSINRGFGDFSISGLDGTTRETPRGELLAINEEKGLFAVLHENKSVQIWDLNSSSLKTTLPLVNSKIDKRFFSPDGQSIAVLDESLKKITLQNINSKETQTFEGSDISFSRDSKVIAITTKEYDEKTSQFQLRDVDGRTIKDLEGAEVEFSPNSKTFAGIIHWQKNTLGEKPIKLWSIDGTELKTFQGFNYKFSPDGSIIAITDSKGIHLWKTVGEKVFTFENAKKIVFSPDSKVVAIESPYGWTTVYTPLGKDRRSAKGTNAKFSPNSKILVLDLSDDRDKFVNLETGHEEVVSSKGTIWFSQDSSLMGFVSSDNTLRIMGAESASKPVLLANRNSTFSVSPKTILVSKDKTLEFWNTVGQKVRSVSINSADYRYGFNKDGSVVYVVSDANPNEIWLFNDSGNLLRKLSEHTDKISSIEVSPDGQTIASLSQDGTIRSWNIYSGKALKPFSSQGSSFIVFTGNNTLTSTFWDDSKKKEVVRILDVNTGKESTSIAFNPSQLADEKSGWRSEEKYNVLWFGDRVVSILKDGTLKVQKADGQTLLESKSYKKSYYKKNVKFSSDNRKIAFLNKSGDIEIWDLTQQTQIILNAEVYAKTPRQFLEGGKPTVYFDDFDFSPNSQMIVASYIAITGKGATQINPSFSDVKYKMKTIVLDAKGIAILEDLESQVSDITFSPNGEMLAAYLDENVDFWSLSDRKRQKGIKVFESGQRAKNLSGNLSQNIRFTPDGKSIIYSKYGQSFLWSFDLDHLMNIGCNRLHDYLTNNPTVSKSDRQMCGITSKP